MTVYSQFLIPNFHYCDTFAFTYTINIYCIIISFFTSDPQLCFREINIKQKKKKKYLTFMYFIPVLPFKEAVTI